MSYNPSSYSSLILSISRTLNSGVPVIYHCPEFTVDWSLILFRHLSKNRDVTIKPVSHGNKKTQRTSPRISKFGRITCASMEAETVKLLKALGPLPNMLRKMMPMVVVPTKYSQGKKDLWDPYTMDPGPMGLNLNFIILYYCAVPPEIYKISSHSTYDK